MYRRATLEQIRLLGLSNLEKGIALQTDFFGSRCTMQVMTRFRSIVPAFAFRSTRRANAERNADVDWKKKTDERMKFCTETLSKKANDFNRILVCLKWT